MTRRLDRAMLVLMSVDWGDVPGWVEAVGTSSAFLIAAISFGRSVRERRERQAKLVYSSVRDVTFGKAGYSITLAADEKVVRTGIGREELGFSVGKAEGGPWTLSITGEHVTLTYVVVSNASDELIDQVTLVARSSRRETPEVTVGTMEPRSLQRFIYVTNNSADSTVGSLETRLSFIDAAGRHWSRMGAYPIRLKRWPWSVLVKGIWGRVRHPRYYGGDPWTRLPFESSR